jgi:3-phosphoshikimate 1-carboxyvinyltransferase
MTNNPTLALHFKKQNVALNILLPSSKSESNRVLLIDALCKHQTGQPSQLQNLSTARDTGTMQRLLASNNKVLDVLDAGTTMRFLAAYCTITRRATLLTGTARMCERPIEILAEALQDLGASITYTQKKGYPPIAIQAFEQKNNQIAVKGNVSSQYISALLMVAPLLPQGLTLNLLGEVHSKPYIQMTIALMQQFGVLVDWQQDQNTIQVSPQTYQPTSYYIESDWSAASYWYAIMALTGEGSLFLEGLKPQSLQGDSIMTNLGKYFGVASHFEANGLRLTKTSPDIIPNHSIDCSNCPDLAQTLAVLAAATGTALHLKGLQSLRIKETDRIAALQTELQNFGVLAVEQEPNTLYIAPQTLQSPQRAVHTYKDHRMAMAFAPLALLYPLSIENPEVVEKSYPHFWEDMAKVFAITN